MKRENISNLIKESKNDGEKMEELITAFMPLVNSYARKLFFLDEDDAKQELFLAVVEAAKKITDCDNDGACILYIVNAVKYRYSYLCRMNIRKEMCECLAINGELNEYVDTKNMFEIIELSYDWCRKVKSLSPKKKEILGLAVAGYSDNEISEIVNLSRAYVHRVRMEAVKLSEINGNSVAV